MTERTAWTPLELVGATVAALLGVALEALPLVGRSFAAMFRDLGSELPVLSMLATSIWFPVTLGVAVHACVALGVSVRVRRVAIAAACVIGVLGLVSCVVGFYLPIFRIAGSIKAE